MTTKKDIFFHFHDQNTGYDYRFLTNIKDIKIWEDWTELDLDQNDSIINQIEEDYECVHDCYDIELKDENISFIGFTTYELNTEKEFIELLTKWKEVFINLGWANEFVKIEKVMDSNIN